MSYLWQLRFWIDTLHYILHVVESLDPYRRRLLLQHRHLGDDEPDAEGWVAVTGSGGVVKEVKERTVKSREEKEERLETEDIQHLGDISDEVSTVSLIIKQYPS